MDLLGDYAGVELFVIDGESLLQIVLDDPLLAIGRDDDPCSFQMLHALHTLERAIEEFKLRAGNFEIIFWEANLYATVKYDSQFEGCSRLLARSFLYKHLFKLDIFVNIFEDFFDPSWLRYKAQKKPMFIMANDGGVLAEDKGLLAAERILTMRFFLSQALSSGITVALLKGSEYRDSKILSFVYEGRRQLGAPFATSVLFAVDNAKILMHSRISQFSHSTTNCFRLQPDRGPEASFATLHNLIQRFTALATFEYAKPLLFIFVIHCILLPRLSVQERARLPEALHPDLMDIVGKHFLPLIFGIAAEGAPMDFDGRIFVSLTRFYISNPRAGISSIVGPSTYKASVDFLSTLDFSETDLISFAYQFPNSTRGVTIECHERAAGLLPFDNAVFNKAFSLLHLPMGTGQKLDPHSEDFLFFGQSTTFEDKTHWHNGKAILPPHQGGERPKQTDAKARLRELRSHQRFMSSLQIQAATLTGASGGVLKPIVIPPIGTGKSVHSTTKKDYSNKKAKAPKLSSADRLRSEIKKEKFLREANESELWWKDQLNRLEKMDTKSKIDYTNALSRNSRFQDVSMGLHMHLYKLNLLFLQWIEEERSGSSLIQDKYTISIMRAVKVILDKKYITPNASKLLATVFTVLGFGEYIHMLAPTDEALDRPLGFKFVKLMKSKSQILVHQFMSINEHPVIWQLRLFGEYMDRSMDSAPDHRVAFEPDGWQRRVLDCIDEGQSLLVVAPTSAGKTFISYYAMEKVLRESDDGILVYIAPTKALVSQIAAEVHARFSKSMSHKNLWAVHTRDYRIHNPQNCQILITVPEMLAIMLLSPPLASVWTPRIRRIILDEIHSIGQQEGGAVWEQIILLAPCPIIGLSATVGSPDVFDSWLKSVQENNSFKYSFIQHPHRYSHLRKHFYNLLNSRDDDFESLTTYQPSSRTRFIHPVTLLSSGSHSVPSDFSLEARDLLSLYHALTMSPTSSNYNLDSVEPMKFFSLRSKAGFLRQEDVLKYEMALKAIVTGPLANDPVSMEGIIQALTDPDLAKFGPELLNQPPSKQCFKSKLITLLADLHHKDQLPAILFSFDRSHCEIMAQVILDTLVSKEEHWRSKNVEWNRKVRQWENWILLSKERERIAEREKKKRRENDDGVHEAADISWESTFDPTLPLAAFSFAGVHTSYRLTDLDQDIKSLSYTSTPQWVLDALRRGIAVHHAGMNKRYRSLVESLFRQGFVRVMIATGTLALGINAPAKTAVFCGDSPFLTALMYRQCAGRAGRRGYDLLGNVIFYGLPMDRVQRLVLSKLPPLTGNFPLTSTLVMRLFNLLHGSDYAPVAVRSVDNILNLPHVTFGSESGRDQVLHHLRFSIEYLRRNGLLDDKGKPQKLFAIAARLYYTEPSNLALILLMNKGVLHKICAEGRSFSDMQQDFMLLMSHLFGRRSISKAFTSRDNIQELTMKYPSKILLPPLPQSTVNLLKEQEEEILRIFTSYAVAFSRGALTEPDCKLPLSHDVYSGTGSNEPSLFRTFLRDSAIRTEARSPFVANSGHDDQFKSIKELGRTARNGLNIQTHAIPSLGSIITTAGKDAVKSEHALNAYLLDFFNHGQVSTLAAANGIRRGDVWYLLQDFSLTLQTIKVGLEEMLKKAAKEAAAKSTVGEEDVQEGTDPDSGYGSHDPAEMDNDDDDDDVGNTEFKKPDGVDRLDWRVYDVIKTTQAEFNEKFKKMWA